jgi:Putative Ig domain
MTHSHTAPWWLLVPGLALGFAFVAFTGPAADAATGPDVIGTNLRSGPPTAPSAVFTGAASQSLSGSLPGSDGASGEAETFTVPDPGMLPPGVAIDPAGLVHGIPAADGVYGVSVSACDTQGCTPGVVTFMIAPDPAPCGNQPLVSGLGSLGSAAVAVALQNIRLLT